MESEVNRNIEEQLSAFLDGELSADELQLLVRRLERNDEYRATLARYAGIGGMLRNDRSRVLANQLRSNVMSALKSDLAASDDSITADAGMLRQSWFRPAIAAAIAALAITGVLNLDMGPDEDFALVQPVAETNIDPQVSIDTPDMSAQSAPALRAASRARPMNQERMLSYLVSHGEYARSFQGAMMDSRVFVQQASFEE